MSATTPDKTQKRIGLQDHTLSWTDDLPVCHLSGVGFSTNQIYREDGLRKEEHEFEDKSFHFKVDGNYLYGMFDGHDGCKASNFAAQRMPAEILLGQLLDRKTNEDVKSLLREGFESVEKGFFESMDELLADRATLKMQIPEGMTSYEAYQQNEVLIDRIREIDDQIAGGTTAIIALIHNNKLFIANVGNSRALLCKQDSEGRLRVFQLTNDHTLTNENELRRFQQLGIDIEKIQHNRILGNHIVYTRCIGDYSVKGGYKDIEILSNAISEPVISEPEVSDAIMLDKSCSFLLLMSDGLYKTIEDSTGTKHVNAEIASLVTAEFGSQTTLNGVSQAVVDKVVRKHHDAYMTGSESVKRICGKRDDITLLVRNFNYPLQNDTNNPLGGIDGLPGDELHSASRPFFISKEMYTYTNTLQSKQHTLYSNNTASSNDSTQSEEYSSLFQRTQSIKQSLDLDKDGKIPAYVDFSDFYNRLNAMTQEERDRFEASVKLMSGCEPIAEESEPPTPVAENVTKNLENMNNLGDAVKKRLETTLSDEAATMDSNTQSGDHIDSEKTITDENVCQEEEFHISL